MPALPSAPRLKSALAGKRQEGRPQPLHSNSLQAGASGAQAADERGRLTEVREGSQLVREARGPAEAASLDYAGPERCRAEWRESWQGLPRMLLGRLKPERRQRMVCPKWTRLGEHSSSRGASLAAWHGRCCAWHHATAAVLAAANVSL